MEQADNQDVLLGINDIATEGVFRGTGGGPLTYTNWKSDEPDNGAPNGNEDCVVTLGSLSGKWADYDCGQKWSCYSCECKEGYYGDGSTCKPTGKASI